MRVKEYDRDAAISYAKRWAFRRNPAFYDFSRIGGDCTNFASQCVFAGSGTMNFKKLLGWYYRSLEDRTPSWTGVEFLFRFLTENDGEGPFAEVVPLERLEKGDLIQFGRATDDFYHTPVVVGFTGEGGRAGRTGNDGVLNGSGRVDEGREGVLNGSGRTDEGREGSKGEPLLAAHSYDAYARPLSSYAFARVRGLHIRGVRE